MAVKRGRMVTLIGAYSLMAVGALAASSWMWQQNRPARAAETGAESSFAQDVKPVLAQYCIECHNDKDKVADLSVESLAQSDTVVEKRDKWELISQYVRSQQMPPDGHPQPTDAQRAALAGYVDGRLLAYYNAHPDPGKVMIRRLNKSEYNNTVRDLLGVEFQPADDFPQDDSGYGFDNIGDVLSLPPVLMEKYLAAADRIMDEALPTEPPVSKVRHFAATQAEVGFNALGDRGDGWVHLVSLEEDDVAVAQTLPAGDYFFRVKAFSESAGGAVVGQGSSAPVATEGQAPPMQLGVFVNGAFVQDLQIDAREASPQVYQTRIGLPGGKVRVSAAVRRNRGGIDNETFMLNGRIGSQQPGVIYVKYLELEGPIPQSVVRYPARKLETHGEGHFSQDSWVMTGNGDAGITVEMPREEDVVLRAQVSAEQAGEGPVKMQVKVNDKVVQTIDVYAPGALLPLPKQRLFDINLLKARPYVYEVRAILPAGKSRISAALINHLSDPEAENPNLRERTLAVDYLEVIRPGAPLAMPGISPGLAQYFGGVTKMPGKEATADAQRAAMHGALAGFMRRAYRRAVTGAEVDRVMKLYDLARGDGESFETGVKLAFKAVLVSPHFLFLGEPSAAVAAAKSAEAGAVMPLDDFALASRLSYFLWSTMPDDELLALAEKHELRAQLAAQAKRMLASPKSEAFVSNFAGQWLQLRNLPNLAPDKQMFSEFDDGLRRDMGRETELLFDTILHENRSVLEFFTADYTYVNARLGRFYGIKEAPSGPEFVKVSLADTNRRGILTQGSFLTLTSNPTRTSPVKRGKFVLENLLGTPPPPPPPDVPKLEDQHAVTGSLRQQMEAHRATPVCASCHAQMDPIGFGLENFDAIGRWRDLDGTVPVDAGGNLKSGETFKNARELAEIIASKKSDEFLHCLATKLLTYALGRGVEPFDRPAVEKIVAAARADGNRFDTMIMEVVGSLPFENQRGEAVSQNQGALH